MEHNKVFYWLDLIRGIAALQVCIGHIRSLFFQDYADVDKSVFTKAFYFLTGFGHQAVVIFFVLSGFFIIRSIYTAYENSKWSLKNYLIDRLSRLWIVLIPALFITLVLDVVGTGLLPESPAYLGKIENLADINPNDKLHAGVLIGNLFFLQTIFIPTYGSNAPLWSLAYEFWYYIIFPVLFMAYKVEDGSYKKILLCLIGLLLLIMVGKSIALYFLIWLMGGASYFLLKRFNTRFLSKPHILLTIITMFAVVLSCVRVGILPVFFNDFSLGVVTAILVVALVNCNMKFSFLRKIALFISNISFTLYLTHMPFAVLITGLIVEQRVAWDIDSFFMFILICVTTIAYSYTMWLLFEKRTPVVKKWIKAKVNSTRKETATTVKA
ncbi:acyltransferase [Pontibacter sp. SGAir0037]|uniref:acyltransferase family protein n=1 Tax=Pontibacter sp. SGAir0037 TaxID=2571030 RepID=UPI0010CD64C3|nr:acyltransferase [Pontibacter sp. SGAir0037]QCR22596.1 hypothetical protein C1N53_09770 [Pontibacter sp. SGAir0037]